MRKITRKSLKAKCDKLFSEKIRKQGWCTFDGVDDVKCGGSLQCAHIIGRANFRLRWDERNAFCLCAGHHTYYTNHPWEWHEIIADNWPSIYKYVNEHRNEIWDKDYEKVLSNLEV